MPNDGRLGLAVGVGLVIAAAVLFFRADAPPRDPPKTSPAPAPQATPPPPAPGPQRPAPARPTARSGDGARRHTVEAGDTLAGLARRYYGDEGQAAALFEANRDVLTSPDELPAGAVLAIPELPRPAGDPAPAP
jgi:nucleoid-associated protein YgaU